MVLDMNKKKESIGQYIKNNKFVVFGSLFAISFLLFQLFFLNPARKQKQMRRLGNLSALSAENSRKIEVKETRKADRSTIPSLADVEALKLPSSLDLSALPEIPADFLERTFPNKGYLYESGVNIFMPRSERKPLYTVIEENTVDEVEVLTEEISEEKINLSYKGYYILNGTKTAILTLNDDLLFVAPNSQIGESELYLQDASAEKALIADLSEGIRYEIYLSPREEEIDLAND